MQPKSPADQFLFPDTGKHQFFIVTACLATNPVPKVTTKFLPIRGLDLVHVISVPVVPHNPIYQEVVLCAYSSHSVLEEDRVTHDAVLAGAKLVQKRCLYMARKFLLVVSAYSRLDSRKCIP
jgi:hypothetical protein